MLSIILVACSSDKDNTESERMVKTIIIGDINSGYQRVYPGRVDAGQRVELSFQVAGTLKEFPVKEGTRVHEGDLVAQLDDRDYKNRYDAAQAQADTTELNYRRGETLVKSGTIAQATLDELRSKYETARSNANIYEKALKDTRLVAPFDGLVAKTFVDNYQEVQAKQKILSLQNIDTVDILVDVPEKDLIYRENLREGNPGNQPIKKGYVTFDSLGDRRFEAYIKEYGTEADPTTQTYRVKISMSAPNDVNILPGMTANLVMIESGTAQAHQFYVPVNAIATDADGKFYAWILDEKTMQVHKKIVEVGEMRGQDILVTSGLEAGQRIVIAGVPYLDEGMKVRLFSKDY
jgi:RND family efflux transporter MFP subunit